MNAPKGRPTSRPGSPPTGAPTAEEAEVTVTEETTPRSGPILDLPTAVREMGALPMPAGNKPVSDPAELTALEALSDTLYDALYAITPFAEKHFADEGEGLRAAVRAVLDSAQLLQSPETAAHIAELKKANAGLDDLRIRALDKNEALRSRIASLEADREANDREYELATARVAELESERHTTNEALSDAAEQLRVDRDRIADLEAERGKLVRWHGEDSKTITTLVARVDRYRAQLTALRNDALSMRGSLAPNGGDRKVPFELGETLTPAVDWLIARVAELEAAQGTVYRAAHDVIVMGLYRTAAEARKHCEAEARQTEAGGAVFDWIEDEEDGVAELVAKTFFGEEEIGYTVTALEVAAEYDPEADQ